MQMFQVKLMETFTVTRECIVSVEADSMQEAVEIYAEGDIAAPVFEDPAWAEFWSPDEQIVVGAIRPDTGSQGSVTNEPYIPPTEKLVGQDDDPRAPQTD